MIATVLIFLAFTTFIHFGKTGYLLPVTAGLSTILIWFATVVFKRIKILLILALVLNFFIFIYGVPKQELTKMPFIGRENCYVRLNLHLENSF